MLDKTKSSEKNDTPIRIIKKIIVIFVDFLCTSIKSVFKSASFPSSFKLADVTPLYKIERKDMKKNYRSVNILPTLSDIFEKYIFAPMSTFFKSTMRFS